MKLIFLPGASGSTDFWMPVKQNFATDFATQILSYPSFGGYPDQSEVNSMADLQQYVLDQIDQPIVIIAQSMGGIFAVQAALQKPNLIQALVLVATSGGMDLSAFNVKNWRSEYQNSYAVPDWFVQDQTRLESDLSKVSCPVLLVWGDADEISPVRVGEYLASQFSHSQLEIISEGEHDLGREHADECTLLIKEFLALHF